MAQFQTILSTLSQLKASIEAIEDQVRMMNPLYTDHIRHTDPAVQQAARDAVAAVTLGSGTVNPIVQQATFPLPKNTILEKPKTSPFSMPFSIPPEALPTSFGETKTYKFPTVPSVPNVPTVPVNTPVKPKQISPFANVRPIPFTLNPVPNMPPVPSVPNVPPFVTKSVTPPIPLTSVPPVPSKTILSESPILSVGQASEFLRNCSFSLSSYGYRLKESSSEVRKNSLQKAVQQFTYPEVLLKLYSLWFVWKENNVPLYVDRLEEDIQELKKSRVPNQLIDESKVHLSPYGYSMKDSVNANRFQALDKAIQTFTKDHVLKHLTQITHIWISKLSFAQFRKNKDKIHEYSQYVQRLTTDYDYVFNR